jgi:uncharacterized protein (DUF305 family)
MDHVSATCPSGYDSNHEGARLAIYQLACEFRQGLEVTFCEAVLEHHGFAVDVAQVGEAFAQRCKTLEALCASGW